MLIHGRQPEAEHQKIVEQVLQKCLNNGLAVNLEKSEFHKIKVKLLRQVINGIEIKMQAEKVNVIQDWPTPTKKKQVQAFLGFANYYCWFIKNYSAKVKPLMELTKDIVFS